MTSCKHAVVFSICVTSNVNLGEDLMDVMEVKPLYLHCEASTEAGAQVSFSKMADDNCS